MSDLSAPKTYFSLCKKFSIIWQNTIIAHLPVPPTGILKVDTILKTKQNSIKVKGTDKVLSQTE